MNNNHRPATPDKDRYYQIVKWAAERGMPITMHWGQRRVGGSSADDLRAREPGGADRAICGGRLPISTTPRSRACERMKALGIGWTVQDAMYFGGEQFVQQAGPEAGAACRPSIPATKIGVVDRRRNRRAPGRFVQSVHRPAMVPRRQDRRRRRDPRTGGNADPRRRAALLHHGQRLVLARR